MESEKNTAVITVLGKDRVGIIAGVSTLLSENNININDISQTILDGYFTMMMIVDLDGAHMDFEEINKQLQPVREKMNMTIHMQRMDIFDAMHRI
jgi:ACT domain-containing protein